MSKTLEFICDYCGKTEKVDIPSNGVFPEISWRLGYAEACRSCHYLAGEYLDTHFKVTENKIKALTKIMEKINEND